MQCFCILSRTCVWASRLWMVFTVFCNLHPGGEHFGLWWIQLQNTFLHFWHFSFVASLYLDQLCSCYRGCVSASWLCETTTLVSVHPDSADLCVRKYPPFGHTHEQHRKGSIVLVVVEEDVSEPVPVPIAKIAANYILQSTFFGQIRQPARIKSNSKQRQRQRTMICSRDVNMDKQCVRVYFYLFVYIVHHPSV